MRTLPIAVALFVLAACGGETTTPSSPQDGGTPPTAEVERDRVECYEISKK